MSQDNVTLVRAVYDAFNRGDIEGALTAMDPEIEFRELGSIPGAETYHGHVGVRRFVAKLADAFEDLRYEIREAVPRGDKVLVVVEASGRGRGSEAEVTLPFVSVWTARAGRLLRHSAFAEREEALRALEKC